MSRRKPQETQTLSTTALFLAYLAATFTETPATIEAKTACISLRSNNKYYGKPEWFVRNDQHVTPKHSNNLAKYR